MGESARLGDYLACHVGVGRGWGIAPLETPSSAGGLAAGVPAAPAATTTASRCCPPLSLAPAITRLQTVSMCVCGGGMKTEVHGWEAAAGMAREWHLGPCVKM